MHSPRVAFAFLLLASTPTTGVAQDILYGIRAGNVLVRIDTGTLAAADVGTVVGFASIGGLAFGLDHQLYGIDTVSDVLVRIDTTTAAGTLVGAVGTGVTFSTGLGNDPATDRLYGVAQGGVGFSSVLVTYSKVTGAATTIGDTAASAIVGLEFDVGGQLWGVDGGTEELIRIDKATAARTIVGAAGLAAFPGIGGFDVGPSGTLWAVNSPGASYQLLSIDRTTGAPTLVGALTGVTISGVMTGLASDKKAVISPIGSATVEGNSNNAFPFNAATVRRYMQIHGDLAIGPAVISKLAFRVNASTTNFTGTRTFDMELFMGEGSSVTNPSFTYSSNYTATGPTLVIPRTNIVMGPTGQATTPGPNPFVGMALPLATPFSYSGARNLIWEALVHGVTTVGTFSQLDADQTSTTAGTSTITGTGCIATGQTVAMTHSLVQADVGGIFHLSFTVASGPASSPCFLALGFANLNLPFPGLCSNILTDLATILPYGTTAANGAITSDNPPFALLAPNTFAGATLFTQMHAIDLGRPDPIPVTNSNGRSTVIPARNLAHINRVTRLWNNVGGVTAAQAVFSTSSVGYGLVTEFSF